MTIVNDILQNDVLNTLKIVNNKWYGLLTTSRAKVDLHEIAN